MKCEQCGFEQTAAKFCERCGRMMTRLLLDDEEKTDRANAQKGVKMRVNKCHRCGHEQAKGRICAGCGIMLEIFREEIDDNAVVTRLCPSCAVPSTTSRCRNCGERIPGFDE
ncbi:MAG: hypothetical protein JRF33_01410 [Deltaproteobacteria bacterium]|nr:hypothetical protein [Deltaproteobacteria bacterium]